MALLSFPILVITAAGLFDSSSPMPSAALLVSYPRVRGHSAGAFLGVVWVRMASTTSVIIFSLFCMSVISSCKRMHIAASVLNLVTSAFLLRCGVPLVFFRRVGDGVRVGWRGIVLPVFFSYVVWAGYDMGSGLVYHHGRSVILVIVQIYFHPLCRQSHDRRCGAFIGPGHNEDVFFFFFLERHGHVAVAVRSAVVCLLYPCLRRLSGRCVCWAGVPTYAFVLLKRQGENKHFKRFDKRRFYNKRYYGKSYKLIYYI